MELEDYKNFIEFFTKNKILSLRNFGSVENKFRETFNDILEKARLQKNRTKSQATSLVLYLRALKYLFTMHQLTLEGHIEEARILRRNVLEIILLGYLIEHSKGVFKLWEECFEKRVKNTDSDGVVNIPKLRDKKYEVNRIIDNNRETLKQSPKIASLIRRRGEFSTYFSHENVYNIVSRIENASTDSLGKLEVYIGQSAESKNERLHKNLMQNVELVEIVNELVR